MKKIFISTLAVSLMLFSYSCDTDFENDLTQIPVTSGSADFSRYVALGNSLTAGYRDGALYIDGQNESYPSIVASQMKLAGGGDFRQPLMADNLGGIPSVGFSNKRILTSTMELTIAPGVGATTLANIFSSGPYHNMGVPGAKSFHLGIAGYGNPANLPNAANPYFIRFAKNPTTSSVLTDALELNPTFFSLWIGNNDILSYATSGGAGVDQKGNMNPATYGSNDITDPTVFASVINNYVNALTANGAKGVIANIPSVTSIPFFTRVPAMPIAGLNDAQVTQLNGGYAQYNNALAQAKSFALITDAEYQKRLIKFETGIANGAVIVDKDLTNLTAMQIPSYRQTTANDLILLTASAVLTPSAGGGTSVPLSDQYVLTEMEANKVTTATTAYNASLSTIAQSKGLAFVDAHSKMVELSSISGIRWNNVKYTAEFVTGGTFSLDGVHLTGRGAGLIANEFIKAINAKYGSNLPLTDINKYSGVAFP
ncbi:G-D-S-L family lipolytic protein [Chryseobacterium lacus]|uniref:G-D-S-L family lipolytic protein n=1 Tax=Chryseobacterium lacus TaxID=2058346 RepID=A0A368N1U2_9FLAO|nr:G-D-S-L family lipolytic protein [Chryseobacterium lacus]RCU43481.1 G-D-S-L family lipolytic protein [Chryseobacterium lacus]RST28495.1 G-D-S-L family lipolytic protein [Chryseobacterium lacus]